MLPLVPRRHLVSDLRSPLRGRSPPFVFFFLFFRKCPCWWSNNPLPLHLSCISLTHGSRMDTRRHNEHTDAVKLSVHPSRGLVDEKFVILVQNAPPGVQLTVHASHRSEDGHDWEAFAHYVSDAGGSVDVSKDVSLGGTYSGLEPMGLLWSLRPVPGSRPGLRMRKMKVQTPMEVTISVRRGHGTQGFLDQVVLASQAVERWYMAPGVRRIPVTTDGLSATLFLPSGPGPFPGVLDLWGGGGGLVEYRSSLLASHGFASMALNYLSPKASQETGKMVDDSYFQAALRVLQEHPQVLGNRVALVGLCLGSGVCLKIAVHASSVKPRCLVCVSGTHVMPPTGTFDYWNNAKCRYNEHKEVISRDVLLPLPTDPALKVDVGRLQCPLLLIVGQDDQNLASPESAADMKAMMEQAGNSHMLTLVSYPHAGHLIEPPYSPHIRASFFRSAFAGHQRPFTFLALWGGQTSWHSRAQEDAWKKTLDFLFEHLYRGVAPPRSHL
ncbi:peroxisomal succinyl-coenzyme A thioesterase-like isoform X1 [Entelurus aequoreus]|uniref:peroxisomal succinyl-coenzyme A thioesterase-like isoform X1 n=1 Tax=Entelurus aequoreus TaxID=161455 RepID=UPI002B1D92C8|nr:peroxisomal succinyl-coenzyme A thioesterase-like isoform X1 [Entelurus aequoreus]